MGPKLWRLNQLRGNLIGMGDFLAPEGGKNMGTWKEERLELDDKLLMFEQRHHEELNGK